MTLPMTWRYNRKLAAALRSLPPAEQRRRLEAEIQRRPLDMTARLYGLRGVDQVKAILAWEPPASGRTWGPVGPNTLYVPLPQDFDWRTYAEQNKRRLEQQLISQAVLHRRTFHARRF
jgi:hypothetical protein